MSVDHLEAISIFGNPLVSFEGLGELSLRFITNLVVIFCIVRLIFYPRYRQKAYFFSYFIINISVFLVCILLDRMQLNIGFAFGLFAVFSIIRYRTEGIPIKEMTYLFVTIIVAVINALSVSTISYVEILACNAAVVLSVLLLERYILREGDLVRKVRYEKIELIHPDRREEMLQDLKQRLGLLITKVEIQDVDFLNDTANLDVYYRER